MNEEPHLSLEKKKKFPWPRRFLKQPYFLAHPFFCGARKTPRLFSCATAALFERASISLD
jgi:hypothetical protein